MEKQVVSSKIKQLSNAVQNGQLDLVKEILTHGMPKSGPHITGYSILLTALKKKQRKIAKLLINAGCRVEASSTEVGLTPLAHAFMDEDEEIASMLMKSGATISVKYSTKRSTVLHLAMQRKSLKMLRFILDYDINVNFLDSNGKTALQIFINEESNNQSDLIMQCEVIRLLLSRGALVDFEDNDGKTLLHYVVKLKQTDITMSVLQKINDVNSCDVLGRTALHCLLYNDYGSEDDITEIVKLFIEKGAELNIVDWQNVTVAHIAAGKKYFKILKMFLQCLCNVSLQDVQGNTVLHSLLVNSSRLSGNEECINLVDSLLSIAPLENVQNSSGKTPLHLAAENYHYEILEKMLPKLENGNVTDNHGQSLLHILLLNSLSNKNVDIIKLLLNAGVNVDMKSTCGISAVDLALKTGNKSLMLSVLQCSKNLNQYYFQQKGVLHYLSDIQVDNESDEVEVAKIAISCIKQGLNVDILDGLNRTPLCTAVFNRCKNLVKILLDCGANPNFSSSIDIIQYIAARSPLMNVDLEIADMLISKGASIILTFNDLLALLSHVDLNKNIIRLLTHCGNLNVLDLAGNTVLHAILDSELHTNKTISVIFKAFSNFLLSKGISVDAQNKNGETLLHLAAKNKHYKIVEKLLPKFTDVNITDSYGETLLHIISRHFSDENYAIILHLLSSGADVDMKNAHGVTPVHIGLEMGNKYLLLPLLQCSKNLKQYHFEGKSLLHYLSYIHVDSSTEQLEVAEIVKTCIKHEIHVDVLDATLRTPLLTAVLNKCKYMIEFLLDHGADPNYKTSDGSIIEHLTRKSSFSIEDLEIAELLVCKGAGAVITFEGLVSLLKLPYTQPGRLLTLNILDRCENLNVLDSFGNTIIHAFLDSNVNDKAANGSDISVIVEICIVRGVSVNAQNEEGITALHLAAKNKHVFISELLMKNDANVTALDNKGNSVLHFLSMLKVELDDNVEKTMIDLFLKNGCDVNARNILNMTPLLTAIQYGCINMVKALIANGADIECAGGESMSYPLHVAVEYNHATIIDHLLNCGANVYSKREDGKTALHIAAVHGRSGTLTLLLERLMDPDARDNDGRTALHWACWHGNLQMVRELLIKGADVNAENKYNVIPISLSQSSDKVVWKELQRYVMKLKTAGADIGKHSDVCIDDDYRKQIDTVLLVSSAEVEISKMKKKRLNNYTTYTTLADVLRMNLNKLAVFKNNEAFKTLITSDNFDSEFPFYSSIIKSFCARGIVRSNLFNEGTKVLRQFNDSLLPEVCAHEIFKYLSNHDLINFIQAKLPNSRLNETEDQHWRERRFCHQQEMYAIMSI